MKSLSCYPPMDTMKQLFRILVFVAAFFALVLVWRRFSDVAAAGEAACRVVTCQPRPSPADKEQ